MPELAQPVLEPHPLGEVALDALASPRPGG